MSNKGIVVITGGGRGIGAACAQLFHQNGYKVFLAARTENELKQVCHALDPSGESAAYAVVDLKKEVSVQLILERCKKQLGVPTILINNAGRVHLAKIVNEDLRQWRDTFAVNLDAVLILTQQALRVMPAGSSIINVSSISGVYNTEKLPKLAAYSASKAGLIALSEVTAVEGKEKNITCVCISPGSVETRMLRSVAGPQFPKGAAPETVAQAIFEAATTKREQWNGKNVELFR